MPGSFGFMSSEFILALQQKIAGDNTGDCLLLKRAEVRKLAQRSTLLL